MTPQEKLVIDYIKQRVSITQREASADLGIDRLASRISDLRKGVTPDHHGAGGGQEQV